MTVTPAVDVDCIGYQPDNHRPGTKAAAGRCSWTENCPSPPTCSVTVRTPTRTCTYAVCNRHHLRIHQYFTPSGAAPTREVAHLLDSWADGFASRCRAEPSHPLDAHRTADVTFGRRGLESDECAAFLRTWRLGYVAIEADGSFTLPRLGVCPPKLHLVGRSDTATCLHTEYLIHLGVVAELVDDHRWPLNALAFEQGEWDILGHADGRVTLAVEAKARTPRSEPDGLERLEDSLLALAEEPNRTVPDNHCRKWRALVEFLSRGDVTVGLVASGSRRWYHATTAHGGVTLTQIDQPLTEQKSA